MSILNVIAEKTKERIEAQKKILPFDQLKAQVYELPVTQEFPFEQALRKKELSFICEVKKASPSKGIIAEEFPYLKIASEYEAAGADAISCLTEPFYFLGKDEYLKEITDTVSIPVLRKDFTIDPYMIYEAKLLGASAVLLICSIMTKNELKEYSQIAHELGISALVETHTPEEIEMALSCGSRIIGVNNRNLKNFEVDIDHSRNLRKEVPSECLFVSESGIRCREDVIRLEENGTDAVLIGEQMMRATDKKKCLSELKGIEE